MQRQGQFQAISYDDPELTQSPQAFEDNQDEKTIGDLSSSDDDDQYGVPAVDQVTDQARGGNALSTNDLNLAQYGATEKEEMLPSDFSNGNQEPNGNLHISDVFLNDKKLIK